MFLFLLGCACALASSPPPDPSACPAQLAHLALKSPLEQFRAGLNRERAAVLELETKMKTGKLSNITQEFRKIHDLNDALIEQSIILGRYALTLSDEEDNRIAYAEALHDLKNLLIAISPIKEYAYNKKLKEEDREKMRDLVTAAEKSTQRAQEILKGMLSGEPMPVRKKTTSTRTLFRDLEILCAGFKDMELTWDAPLELPSIEGDPLVISRALLNLVSNARRHAFTNQKDGKVHLQARIVPASDINEVSGGNYLELSVMDNGSGIPKDKLPSIFKDHYTTHSEGQGLGLSSVMEAVDKHHAVLKVNSDGGGSTFRMLFPTEGHLLGEAVPELQAGTILIADDERAQRMMMKSFAGKEGPAHAVMSGNAAVQAVAAHPDKIRMVFLDMNMPGLTLSETVEELLLIKPDIKIVVATADDNVTSFPGVAQVIQKPVSAERIRQILNSH